MLTMALVQAALSVPVVMLLSRFIYPSALRTVSFIATLSLVSAAVEQLLLLRVRSRSATWEYLG
jgi:hypothetical protein